ncbi:MAG: 3-mercaptopyruvate sulfurtransferase [Sphingomicrobium sp.]
MDDLVTTDWLERNLGAQGIATVDCSFFMLADQRDPAAEFIEAHIPGARFLDIGAVSDRANPAPHMLPSAEQFAAAMTALGVGQDDRIVVYDNSPLRTAARGWFMFRHFGAERVAILDGGLQKWKRESRRLESGAAIPRKVRFDAHNPDSPAVTKEEVLRRGEIPLLDARGRARFEGEEADPRPGIAAGHIAGSRNLPYSALYQEDGTFKSVEALRAEFAAAGVDPEQPFIASCGSGVTANSLIFAARRLGGKGQNLYDGSWSEYGADPDTPKELGPARV